MSREPSLFLLLSVLLFCSAFGLEYRMDKELARERGKAKTDSPIDLTSDSDEIVITLTEQPSVGMFWNMSFDTAYFSVLSDDYLTPASATSGQAILVGGVYNRTVRLIGIKKQTGNGAFSIQFRKGQLWKPNANITDTFNFTARVRQVHAPVATKIKNVGVGDQYAQAEKLLRGQAVSYPEVYDPRSSANYPPVRNQANCGSCWAFATVGQLEVMYALKCNSTPPDLSEQYLVSCNVNGYSCSGGAWSHQYHYNYVITSETQAGAVPEASFPYTATDAPCNGHPYPHTVKLDSGITYISSTAASIMSNVYTYGAVGTYICANSAMSSWKPTSTSPYFTGPDCTGVNHAVVIVGYDSVQQYWIIRNSWGSSWGAGGYLYIQWGLLAVGTAANIVQFSGCNNQNLATKTPTPTTTQSTSITVTSTPTSLRTTTSTATTTHTLTPSSIPQKVPQQPTNIPTPLPPAPAVLPTQVPIQPTPNPPQPQTVSPVFPVAVPTSTPTSIPLPAPPKLTCTGFSCPIGKRLKLNAANITCLSAAACTADECCYATAVCTSFICPSGSVLWPNASSTTCSTSKCASSECCYATATCAGFKCPSGRSRISNPNSKTCASKPCTVDECCLAKDCVGAFETVSSCSVTCGSGALTQTYRISENATVGGAPCPYRQGATKTVSCNTQTCPARNCVGAFVNIGGCSKSCGNGQQVQKFKISVTAANGGRKCAVAENATQSIACNSMACPGKKN